MVFYIFTIYTYNEQLHIYEYDMKNNEYDNNELYEYTTSNYNILYDYDNNNNKYTIPYIHNRNVSYTIVCI